MTKHRVSFRISSILLVSSFQIFTINAISQGTDFGTITGIVKDSTGALVAGAEVALRNAQRSLITSTLTDQQGQFTLSKIPLGHYEIVVTASGFSDQRRALTVGRQKTIGLAFTLEPGLITETVTVTAEAGMVEDRRSSVQSVNLIGNDQLALRSKSVLVQVAAEEPGLNLQRTAPSMGGIFVRGLTGSKVNVYLDGVRYSTAAARGGVNTFLNLVGADQLSSIEVIRGPKSTDYGSDAIGGSLQLIATNATLAPSGRAIRRSYSTHFNSSDLSFGSSLTTSFGTQKFGVAANLSGSRINTTRPGGGIDTHSAFTRFLGLRSDVTGDSRLPDTGFTQYGGVINLTWTPSSKDSLRLHYQRGQQDGGKRYDQLLGGDGNLIADLRNLMLDFFYVKYDRQRVGWLDNLMLSTSLNLQREERVNQGGNGNARAAINHEYEKTRVHGVQARGDKFWKSHQIRVGGEYYHEGITAPSFGFNPVTGVSTLRRGRVPDQAQYRSWGVYLQDVVELIAHRLKLVGGLRYTGASYRARVEDAPVVGGRPLWPSDSFRASDLTGRAGILIQARSDLNFAFHFSRGFRAPHITDLGTLGLTGSGFEVAEPEASRFGGLIGSTAGSDAVSTGRLVTKQQPEVSFNYEGSVRYYHQRLRAEVSVFTNEIKDLISKQALILPPGAVGLFLGGERITSQAPTGLVFVAAATNPVLVRANFGDARIWGIEHTFDATLTNQWSIGGVYTYIRAKEIPSGLPPNIEGGTPAPDGWLRVRYSANRRFWIEPYLHAARRQTRLSSLDLEDRRTGGLRSRSSIANFFFNGATARGLVGPGLDGRLGTADDVLLPTGETLAQVQNRVLGVGVSQAPLITALPGYATINVRSGLQLHEDHTVVIEVENIADKNYRGISWGMDAPGRSVYLRYQWRF